MYYNNVKNGLIDKLYYEWLLFSREIIRRLSKQERYEVMSLKRNDWPGVAGGVVFAFAWLAWSGFENYLLAVIGGLLFTASWFAGSRLFKK